MLMARTNEKTPRKLKRLTKPAVPGSKAWPAVLSRMTAAWEMGAKRELALWKQNLRDTRTLVHSKFLLGATKSRGMDVEALVNHQSTGDGGALYQSALKEVQTKMEEWEENIKVIEEIVYGRYLLKGAEEHGINIQMISEDPLSVYMEKKSKTKDVGIMVATECPLCTSFVDDMEVN